MTRPDQMRTEPTGTPGWHAPSAAAWCWIAVLALIGGAQVARAQWFDTAVFVGALVIVAADACGLVPESPHVRVRLRTLVVVAVVAGVAAAFVPRHGAVMKGVVIAAGLAAVAAALAGAGIAHPGRAVPFGRGIRRLALAWAIVVIVGCLWELAQFILGLVHPEGAFFSLSDLLNPLVATVPGKIVFTACWLAAGVWLLRRGGRR